MKKKLLSLLLALLTLTTTALAVSPDILCGAGGRYEAVGVPAGARLFAARYAENGRFLGLEVLSGTAGTVKADSRLFLLGGETSQPLCHAPEARPAAPVSYALIERITNQYAGDVYSDYLGNPADVRKFTVRGLSSADKNGNYKGDPGYSDAFADHGSIVGESSNSGASLWDGNRARLILANGTVRNVTLSRAYLVDDADGYAGKALRFGAGDVVRCSVDSDGDYSLHELPAGERGYSLVSDEFYLKDHRIYGVTYLEDGTARTAVGDGSTIIAARNSEYESYRVYTGIQNAPDINSQGRPGTAYAYVEDGVVKALFVVEGPLTNDGTDVTFVAQTSMSKLWEQDDTVSYYTYNAVVKGEITTIKVASGDNFTESNTGFVPGTKVNADAADAGVIFNAAVTNSGGIYTSLNNNGWDNTDIRQVDGQEGIRVINDMEIRLGTANNQRGALYCFANGAKVFLVDNGGGIECIETADIETNFRTRNYAILDDGEITTLFICETTDRT